MANKKTSDTTIRMSEGKVNPRGHFIMFYHSGVLEGTFAAFLQQLHRLTSPESLQRLQQVTSQPIRLRLAYKGLLDNTFILKGTE